MKLDYSKTDECVKGSFTNQSDFQNSADNQYLKEDMIQRAQTGVRFLPEITINGIVYKGALDPVVVFEAICNSFEDIPESICNIQPSFAQEAFAVLTLFGMLCFVLCRNGIFLYVGHKMRRQIIEDEARRHVQEYMQLHQSEDDP